MVTKIKWKGESIMTIEEFKDHLFDVINESHEILVQDIKVDEITGDIIVTLFNKNEFVVKCEKR